MPKRERRPFVFLALVGDSAGKRFSGASSPSRPFPSSRTTNRARCVISFGYSFRLFPCRARARHVFLCPVRVAREKVKFIRRTTRGMSPWVRNECPESKCSHAMLKLDTRWRHKRKKHEDASPLCGWLLLFDRNARCDYIRLRLGDESANDVPPRAPSKATEFKLLSTIQRHSFFKKSNLAIFSSLV